jgi:hypothetical protein
MKTNLEPNRANTPATTSRQTWQSNLAACLCGVTLLCIGLFGKDINRWLIKDAMPSAAMQRTVEERLAARPVKLLEP